MLVHAHDLMRRQAECWSDEVRPALPPRGITLVRWARTRRRGPRQTRDAVPGQDLPVLTPWPSAHPLHLGVVAEPRRSWATRRRAPSCSPGPKCRPRWTDSSRWATRASSHSRTSSPSTSTCCSRHGRAAAPRLPGDPTRIWKSRRTTPRTCSKPLERGAEQAPFRPAGAGWRSTDHRPARAGSADP